MATVHSRRATCSVDLAAIRANVRQLRAASGVPLMAVVKADGYGHGAIPVAFAAKDAGAEWLGVAYVDEALELRNAGVPGPILAWLLSEDDGIGEAMDQDIDLSIATEAQLLEVADIARVRHSRARVHIEVDTGLSRGGVTPANWHLVFTEAQRLHSYVEVISIWSHLACADEPTNSENSKQAKEFDRALAVAAEVGVRPQFTHLANSAAALMLPDLRAGMVRCGIAIYGVTPGGELPSAEQLGLKPAMKVTARIAQVRTLRPGDSVSYGFKWTAERETTVGLIPVGYADGIPRAATNLGSVTFKNKQYPIVGTVCMDQFVVDFGSTPIHIDDEVLLFGGEGPSAHDWAASFDSIGYELVTRLGSRIPREYVDGNQ